MLDHEFGARSIKNLDTCHKDLQRLACRALQLSPYDFSIIHGWRDEEVQNALHASNASEKRWPDSKHNHFKECTSSIEIIPESLAVDFAPWISGDIPWHDTHIFSVIAGCFFAAAAEQGITIRWGGDWDSDGSTKDQKLMDYGHIELVL